MSRLRSHKKIAKTLSRFYMVSDLMELLFCDAGHCILWRRTLSKQIRCTHSTIVVIGLLSQNVAYDIRNKQNVAKLNWKKQIWKFFPFLPAFSKHSTYFVTHGQKEIKIRFQSAILGVILIEFRKTVFNKLFYHIISLI